MRTLFIALCIMGWAVFSVAALDPLTFEEISLWVRLGEPSSSIVKEVQNRKLLQPPSAQELDILKAQGAGIVILNELRRPEHIVSAETAADVKARLALRKQSVVHTTEPQEKRPATVKSDVPEAVSPPSANATQVEDAPYLVIEKVVILKAPFEGPFYVYFRATANNGQAEAVYHVPGKQYQFQGVASTLELPVNLVLKGVQENDWATVSLHLDTDDAAVTTLQARKRNTSRIPITNRPLYQGPFEFAPPRGTFIVSLNFKQDFVYQVYWRVRGPGIVGGQF